MTSNRPGFNSRNTKQKCTLVLPLPHEKGTNNSNNCKVASNPHEQKDPTKAQPRYSGIPQRRIPEAFGNICSSSSTVYFQSMSEHKKRIKFLIPPPPPPSYRDDTANRIKWVTGLYDHYIKVVHMQNLQNTEKKNYQRGCTICLWRKKQQLVQGAARCQPYKWQDGKWQETAFHSSNSKRNVQPVFSCLKTSRCCPLLTFPYLCSCNIWKLFYFYRGRGKSTKPSNVYIFFSSLREDVEWILITIAKKKENEKSAVFDVRNLWNFILVRRNRNVFGFYKGCVW